MSQLTKEQTDAALEIAHREFFMNVLATLSYTDLKEVSYHKVPIVTEDGGTYLVSILHVDGPKIQLDPIREGDPTLNSDPEPSVE